MEGGEETFLALQNFHKTKSYTTQVIIILKKQSYPLFSRRQ